MSIKILGGALRGISLDVPASDHLRPTSVLLKRRLFDSFQHFENYHFIDLCAGSGSVGIEAISRGAESVEFIESNRQSIQYLEKNLKKIKIKPCWNIRKVKAEKWIKRFKIEYSQRDSEYQKQCILFFDPPYEDHKLYESVISLLVESKWFFGTLWVESDVHKGPSNLMWERFNLKADKIFEQGSRYIYIFQDL